MSDLDPIGRIPNVTRAVLGDVTGVFHDALREEDGESVAAVTGFISTRLGEAGEQLGLGALGRVTVTGPTRACILAVRGRTVFTVGVEPPSSAPAVERALDANPGLRG